MKSFGLGVHSGSAGASTSCDRNSYCMSGTFRQALKQVNTSNAAGHHLNRSLAGE